MNTKQIPIEGHRGVLEMSWRIFKSIVKWLTNNDNEVMSDEVREIMSNPQDKEKYLNALKELRDPKGEDKITIKLSNKEELTLIK